MQGWLWSAGVGAQTSRFSPGTLAFGDTGDAVVLGRSLGRSALSSFSSHWVVSICSWNCDCSGRKGLHLRVGPNVTQTDRLGVDDVRCPSCSASRCILDRART